MSVSYAPFLAWNPVSVTIGANVRDSATYRPVALDWTPGLIRNCSFARVSGWIGVSGEDRTHGGQALTIFDLRRQKTTFRFPFEIVLNHALDVSGVWAAIALPSENRQVADLILLHTRSGDMERIVTGRLHHRSTLSWFPDHERIAYEHADDEIEVVNRSTRVIDTIGRGRSPAVGPDGSLIAAEQERGIALFAIDSHAEKQIDTGRVAPTAGLSWSPDSQRLTFGGTHGLTGKETRFSLLDVVRQKTEVLPLEYQTGLSLISADSALFEETGR